MPDTVKNCFSDEQVRVEKKEALFYQRVRGAGVSIV